MKKRKTLLIIAIAVFVDQLIKLIVLKTIAQTGHTVNILNLIQINYLENRGSSFGIFNSNWFIIILDILIIVVLLRLIFSKKYEFTDLANVGLGLILSGGLGNLIDRIFRGFVIDYIDISKILNYPIFNLADICIVVGFIMLMAIILINTVKSQENADEKN